MKVTFCAYDDSGYFCGPNTWLRRLLPDLKGQGLEVSVLFVAHSDPAHCPTIAALESGGIPCKAVSGLEFTERRIQWILKSLCENTPDVFVPNLVVAAFYAAKWVKECEVPTVGVVHSDDEFHYGLLNEFVFGRPDYRLSALVCVSEYLEQQVLSREPNETIIRRIPYGVPITGNYCHWSDGPLRLVYTGRLKEQQKRITEVTRALCKVVRTVPGTEAYIYGDGPERTTVENILLREGKNLPVFLKGFIDADRIQQNLPENHIFVLLSDYEGLPISLMEAMACGLVPVCLKISSGIPELINSGKNGILVDDRAGSFVSAVRRLREDRYMWERMSKAARATIESCYSHGDCVKSWVRLLEDVKGLQSAHGIIRVPRRISLPPLHPGLSREDTRRPTKCAVIKNRVKGMHSFSQRVLRACMPQENNSRHTFLSVRCTPALLDQFIVRTAIERALRETVDRFHGVLLDVGSKSKPYKSLLIAEAKNLSGYFALDLKPSEGNQFTPDIVWDGTTIPLINNAIGCAIATEVFEHLPEPQIVMREILRVLKPGGILFFTVPFLWRLHTVPFDQYRYTPFALERHLKNAGFANVQLTPLGGPDASLGQILALWAKGRSQNLFYTRLFGPVLSFLCTPLVWLLDKLDTIPTEFHEGCLITGLSGTAVKLDSISGK